MNYTNNITHKKHINMKTQSVKNVMDVFHFLLFLNFSPTKATFIKAKYQRLAFVPRLPCKDDDTITVADLSQVES